MERLYSDIAKEYILNTSYLPKVLVQLVDTEGPDGGMVGGWGWGDFFLVIS